MSARSQKARGNTKTACQSESPGRKATGSEQTVNLTVGTAGHIDHGKTELIKFLTGCDTDRLPEEKARGMTIDLGFATCVLPDHQRVGIVDVPGHEKFIHNMVAGATGIDVVLLVVAADDGVMPQTIEHFHIVRLLGVSSGMIAITKTDLVDAERVDEVKDEISLLTEGSFLESCPVVPVSSKTGQGFEEFYSAFVATVNQTAERDASGPFRLHIERSFVLQGLGTIVSGVPRSGTVRLGDTLDLLPAGVKKKVRGIQVYGRDAEEARAGECVALNIADLTIEEAARGAVLASPGYFIPTPFVNARLCPVPGLSKPIRPRTAVRFHVGTSDVPGHLMLPDLSPLTSSEETYVQFQLKNPVVAAPGDFFVVRLLSPVITIGGGHVITPDHAKMRRSKGDWAHKVKESEEAFKDPCSAIVYVLENAGPEPVPLSDIAQRSFVNEDSTKQHLATLMSQGIAVALAGMHYAHSKHVLEASDEIMSALQCLHDKQPLCMGFPKKTLFPELKQNRLMVEKALGDLVDSGRIKLNRVGFQIPELAPQLSDVQLSVAEKIRKAFKDTGFSSPRRDQLPEIVGAPGSVVNPIIDFLVQAGDIVIISDKIILHGDFVDLSKDKLVGHLEEHGSLESGTFKDILGTTRKYSIPILEYWDEQGLTKRAGNKRLLREK